MYCRIRREREKREGEVVHMTSIDFILNLFATENNREMRLGKVKNVAEQRYNSLN